MSGYGEGYQDRYNPYDRGGYERGGYDEGGYGPSGYGPEGGDRAGSGPAGYERDDRWGERGGYDRPPAAYDEPRGYGGYDEDAPEPPDARRGRRMLLAAGIGAVALVVVGAVAFGGSLLLSKSSGAAPQTSNVAAGAPASTEAGDLFAGASGDPAASTAAENATTTAPAPTPTTKAPATTAAAPKPTTKKPTTATGGSNVAYENQVLAIVNTERAKAGCQPLAYNAKLRAAAYKHSADMAAKDYFSHDSQDGTSFATRITNEGYRWSNAAENIAKGQRTPEEVMNSWMNSSGHRANILNCKLKDLGVGLAYEGKTAIWTQDFGTQM